MPTISFSIGGEEHDISNKSSKEVLDMVKTEYKKKKVKATPELDMASKLKKLIPEDMRLKIKELNLTKEELGEFFMKTNKD